MSKTILKQLIVAQAEHEAVSNQYELNFGFADAMTSADRHFFLKFMVKVICDIYIYIYIYIYIA